MMEEVEEVDKSKNGFGVERKSDTLEPFL